MPTLYMALWSTIIIGALGLWRMRAWSHMVAVTAITAAILLLTHSLFSQLSQVAGLPANAALLAPADYLGSGPAGWLALLVMPFGWLGPVVGLHLVQKWLAEAGEDGA